MLIDTIIPVMYLTFTSNTTILSLAILHFFLVYAVTYLIWYPYIERLKQEKRPKSNLSAITNILL